MIIKDEVYIGIDLDETWTQISYWRPGMADVETVSTIAGQEKYRIKTPVFGKTLSEEERKVFKTFLKKVLRYVPDLVDFTTVSAVTVQLKEVSSSIVLLLQDTLEKIGIAKERVFVQNSNESFVHFAMNQKKELMLHDMVLFQCEKDELTALYLTRVGKTVPQRVSLHSLDLGKLPVLNTDKDLYFAQMAESVLKGKIVSSVYLMGDGFDGEWLKSCLTVLCRNRRVFQGKNLLSKGACYSSVQQACKENREYIFFDRHVITNNIFLQVRDKNGIYKLELVEAGTSCYEVKKSCQVLLSGEACIDVLVQAVDNTQKRIESLQLTDLPNRPPKATKLLIEALPGPEENVRIRITDMGFGPWYASSGKVWEYNINE